MMKVKISQEDTTAGAQETHAETEDAYDSGWEKEEEEEEEPL
jgi:hypothetical protein